MHERSVAAPLALIVVGLLAAGAAVADPPEGKGWKKHRGGADGVEAGATAGVGGVLVHAGISVTVARQYAGDFGGGHGVDNGGYGGYKPLPPGIRKNLARGKPLPPGIAKRSVPSGMMSRLPQHPGYEWQAAGTDLVLVQIGTAIVADVLRDVFR